jgi:malonate-semialdehyde dehydrogenase (acetylating)/methylmalonate-semialdehyde dehydrogenase
MEDCVLERTVAGIINSTYGCAGQRCMALPVVCVQESIADEFVALLKKKAMELKLGPAYVADSQLGPLVSAAQKQSVENWIQRGVEEGATLVLDGRGAKVAGCENGYFVGPTIFDNVKPGTPSATRKSSGR